MSETPTGWLAWEYWKASDQYLMLMKNIRAAIMAQAPLDLALSVDDLASCAFRAGLEAGLEASDASIEAPPIAYEIGGRSYCSACGDSGSGPCRYHTLDSLRRHHSSAKEG